MALYQPLFAALNAAGVRYVVVGGLAVVLHGHARLTADVDLVIDLEPDAARQAIAALSGAGLQPRLPVDPVDFADPATREEWIRDRGMRVFSMHDPKNPLLVVDLFVEHPIDFEALWSEAELIRVPGAAIRVASIDHLIRLKEISGRPQDREDIEQLKSIRAREQRGDDA